MKTPLKESAEMLLRNRIEELEEEVRQLQELKFGFGSPLPRGVTLTHGQQTIWNTLVRWRGKVVPHECLLMSMQRWNSDSPPDNVLKVQIHHIRSKIRKAGLSEEFLIENIRGLGYRLAKWSKEFEDEILKGEG